MVGGRFGQDGLVKNGGELLDGKELGIAQLEGGGGGRVCQSIGEGTGSLCGGVVGRRAGDWAFVWEKPSICSGPPGSILASLLRHN